MKVGAADFAQEDALGGVIEEGNEAQGEGAAHPQPPRSKRALACEGASWLCYNRRA
jgi:hypothetical protein